MVLGASPHEDPLVGAALAFFGAALLVSSPRLPHVEHLPSTLVACVGMALCVAIAAGTALAHTGLNVTKAAVLAAGLALVACAPLIATHRTIPWRGDQVPLATVAAAILVALAAPLAVWGAQATFKDAFGATPVETFVAFGLLVPLAFLANLAGLHAVARGQDLIYATPRGQLDVQVGAACSGVEAMAVFTAVLALYCLIERPGGRALGMWSLVGLIGVYVANILRLTLLVAVGYWWGTDALLRAHAEAGWIVFVAWALVFSWLVRSQVSRSRKRGAAPLPQDGPP
ncbi:MAG: exosortase/archaeosortase family protein [bacterium]